MKWKALLVGLLLSTQVFAGTTSTIVHDTAVYTPTVTGAKPVIFHDKDGKTALDQCFEAWKAADKATCTDVYGITNVANCDGITKPVIPKVVDADGFTTQPPIRYKETTTGTLADTEVQDYIPAAPPTCWVLGYRDITMADLTDNRQEGLVGVMEPVPVSDEFNTWWHSVAAQEERHKSWYCYSDDTIPCPPKPDIPSECGPYDGVGCGGPKT